MNRAYLYLTKPVAAVAVVMAVLLGAGPGVVQASVTPTEHVVFSDDFDNNNNNWQDIGTISDTATISSGELFPAVDSDGVDVEPFLTGSTAPLDLSRAPISVFARVRVDANSADANRFYFGIEEDGSSRDAILNIRPGDAAQLWYRNSTGTRVITGISSFTFPAPLSNFVDFKLTLTDNGDGSMTLEAFKMTSTDLDFVSLGSVANADLDTGIFGSADQADPGQLSLYMRNGSGGSKRAYFDSIAVTQVPEPSTMFLFVSGAASLWWYRRRVRE